MEMKRTSLLCRVLAWRVAIAGSGRWRTKQRLAGRSVVLLVLLVLRSLAVQCSSGCRGDGAIDAVRRGEDAAGVWECGRRHSGMGPAESGVWC